VINEKLKISPLPASPRGGEGRVGPLPTTPRGGEGKE